MKTEIHARLPAETYTKLQDIAKQNKQTLSDVVRAAVVLYLDAYRVSNKKECANWNKLFRRNLEVCLIGKTFEETAITPNTRDTLPEDYNNNVFKGNDDDLFTDL